MLTKFGKELKKLRIDHGMSLADLGSHLGVSAAFLSGVENGKKRVPDDFYESLSKVFEEVRQDSLKFETLINHARAEVVIPVGGDIQDAELATVFANKFKKLSSEEKIKILELLNQK